MKKSSLLAAAVSVALIASSMTTMAVAAQPAGKNGKVTGGEGGAEVDSLAGPAVLPQDANANFTAQGCYDTWWVSGSHSWKWKTAILYSYNTLSATTWTRYGSFSTPCDIPLVSDWLRTKGSNEGASAGYNASVDKTEYNVSTSSAYDKVTATAVLAAFVCGAAVTHTAYKSGVQWSYTSRSGCS